MDDEKIIHQIHFGNDLKLGDYVEILYKGETVAQWVLAIDENTVVHKLKFIPTVIMYSDDKHD